MRQVARDPQSSVTPFTGQPKLNNSDFRSPSFGDLMGSAFRSENDVYAAWDYLTRPEFEPDPLYDVSVEGPKSDLWDEYWRNLSAANSAMEFSAIEDRVRQEVADREVFAASGTGASMAAAMFAGMVSPTALVPLVGPARGAKGVAQAFALAGAASTAQEAVLFAAQETRTPGEAALGVTAGTVLGGLLGSGAVMLKGSARATALANAEADMAGVPSTMTILKTGEDGDFIQEPTHFYDMDEAFDLIVPQVIPQVGGRNALETSTVPYQLPKKFPIAVNNALRSNALHSAARAVDEPTFRAYDNLITRRDTYRQWIDDLQTEGQLSVDKILNTLTRQAENLEQLQTQTKGKGPKAILRKQLREKRKEIEDLLEAREGANAVDIAKVREQLKAVDEKMRDLAPRIGAAYKKARANFNPEEIEYDSTLNSYTNGEVVDAPFALAEARTKATIYSNDPVLHPRKKIEVQDDVSSVPPSRGSDGNSVNAAEVRPNVEGIYAPDKFTKRVVDTLGSLQPNIRQINNEFSPNARYWSSQLHDSGVQIDTGEGYIPAALGGTVAHNTEVHTKALGKLVMQIDDAYSRHVMGNKVPEGEYQKAFLAQLKSGTRTLPEGKMTFPEFNQEVFRIMNTGQPHDDPHVTQVADAAREFFDYYRAQEAEAFEEIKLQYGEDAQRLIPEEFNLGQGVMEYIHHLWDTTKVVDLSGELLDDLSETQLHALNKSFEKDYTRFVKRRAKLQQAVDIQEMNETQADAWLAARESDVTKIKEDPGVKYGENYLKQLKADLEDSGASKKQIRDEMKAARDNLGSDYADKRNQLNQLRADISYFRKVREDVSPGSEPAGREAANEINSLRGQIAAKRDSANADGTPNTALIREVDELEAEIEALEVQLRDVNDLKIRIRDMEDEFEIKWKDRGAVGNKLTSGEADFVDRAYDNAQHLHHKLKGDRTRIAGLDILGGKRGPELARGLNIPFDRKMKYLETDIETVARAYARHMGSDIEMWRSTGSVNGARIFDELEFDFQSAQAKILDDKELKGKAKQEALRKLEKQREQARKDFTVMIERIRHQRSRPENPDGFMYRAGRVALSANVARYMGNVVLSSIPDIARPIMMFGLTNTLKHGWGQYMQGLKKINASREELRRFGIGWDTVLHNRAQAIFDIADNYAGRQTLPERGIEFLANKTGFVAMFDKWTQEMKFLAGNVAMGVISDALDTVVKGGKGINKAKRILADAGVDTELAHRIWKQFELPNGSTDFGNGYRLPNTEEWEDVGAIRAYSQMLLKYTNDAIVTPSVDRPNWMDENTGFRLLAQFRSFAFTATNRTMIRGMQQRDMAVLNGSLISLAMGAVSYYTWAMTVGGTAKSQMLEADAETWAYQAVSRSGLLGVLGEVQRVGENVPWLSDMAVFGGSSARTRRPTSLMAAVAGPSFDLAERLASTVQNLGSPTASSIHTARTMLAYQNVFYLRQLYNQMEEAVVNIGGIPAQR